MRRRNEIRLRRIPLDQRLAPFKDFANHALRTLRSQPGGVSIAALIPVALKDRFPAEAAREILTAFQITRYDSRKYYPGPVSIAEIRRGIPRSLNLMLWYVTSHAFSFPDTPSNADALKDLLTNFGGETKYLNACREVLTRLSFGTKLAGGLVIRGPVKRGPISVVPKETVGEAESTTPPTGEVAKEAMLYGSLARYLRERENQDFTKGQENAGWSYLYWEKSTGGRRLPDGENPDLAGVRLRPNFLGIPALEMMTVEVKRGSRLKKEHIHQAEGYFEYSNFVYLALNTTEDMIRKHGYNYEYMLRRGIGLLLLKKVADRHVWYEAVPPTYRPCRLGKQLLRIEALFSSTDINRMRGAIQNMTFKTYAEGTSET